MYDGNQCKRKNTCKYSGKLNGSYNARYCNYSEIAGVNIRVCPAAECDKYERRKRRRQGEQAIRKHILITHRG